LAAYKLYKPTLFVRKLAILIAGGISALLVVVIASTSLTMEEERALAVFEMKILRKMYGPVKGNELKRIRRND
jgi:hypothetical protein